MAMMLAANTPENWLTNAKTLGWICQFSYSGTPEVEKEFRAMEFRLEHPFSVGATQAFLGVRGDDAVLVFRGTEGSKLQDGEGLADVFDDALVRRVPGPGAGEAHRGFLGALGRVWLEVSDAVEALADKRLWLTGHSLGGALAALAAVRFVAEEGRRPAGVFTFGQPRVGDAEFAAWADRELGAVTHRIVHGHDIVSRVPMLGYKHFGQAHFLHRDGGIGGSVPGLLQIGLLEGPAFLADWRSHLQGTPLIADHMIWNYRSKFEA